MSIILTSAVIRELCSNGGITIIQKSQKNSGDYNYYITPNLSLKLYGGKVLISDPKYLVLQFDRYTNINLLNLLRNTTSNISEYLKNCINIDTKLIYPMFNEQENTFTIRVYLPHVRYKYSIETNILSEEKNMQPFTRPRVGMILREARVEIRNLWQNKGRIGFNLELKYLGF
jgi:hypothetical protein